MAEKSESVPAVKNIYQCIGSVMQNMGAVGKDTKNQQQGFMYRGIDAVMNALNPEMARVGMFTVPEILEQIREERTTKNGGLLIYSICKIKYTFYAPDGSSIYAVVIGEGMDSGDKATNKAMAIAFKYACFQVFCIPTEEMKDPDADCHDVKPKEDKKKEKEEAKTPPVVTIDKEHIDILSDILVKKGLNVKTIFPGGLENLTDAQYQQAVAKLSKLKDKEIKKDE